MGNRIAKTARRRSQKVYPLCRHCQERPATRARGLCFRCSFTPGVKEQYPVHPVYGRRGPGANGRAVLPAEPTEYQPGTPEKVAVMYERVCQGTSPFHPLDAGVDRVGSLISLHAASVNGDTHEEAQAQDD